MKKLILAGALVLLAAGTASAQDVAPPKRDSAAAAAKPYGDSMAARAQHPAHAKALDINTATKGELEAAGLGPYADKIIAQRPFKSTKDLVDKQIVPQSAWGGLKDKVKVGS